MQYFLNGYRKGDPRIRPAADGRTDDQPDLPGEVDVLIVGTGPAGLLLAAQLSEFPDIVTRVMEKAAGPLEVGRADGVNCKTVETFEAFGLAERMTAEAYWVNQTNFWGPDPEDPSRIKRFGRVQDVRDGLSEFPHVIVNQARLGDFLLEYARNSPSRLQVDYNHELVALQAPKSDDEPVVVTIRRGDGTEVTVEREVRRRLRRCTQHRARVHRSQAAGRGSRQGLGCHGHPGGDRLPRHPVQGHDPVRQRWQHPAHPPRGRLPGAPVRGHG